MPPDATLGTWPSAAPDGDPVRAAEVAALRVRTETVRLVGIAGTGHYASTFSAAEILGVLYSGVLRLRHGEPEWSERDRLLLGKGHVAVGLYPLLADWGFLDPEVLDGYARLGSPLGDHPDMTRVPGVDFSSGSLGHALSVGAGMALGGRLAGKAFSVFVLLGDGELDEGQVWEAALAGSQHQLETLVAVIDRNGHSLDGPTEEGVPLEPLAAKWEAFGWFVREVDGHDVAALRSALLDARDRPTGRPMAVIAHTVKGKGVSFMESAPGWHLGFLGPSDEERVLQELGVRS